MADFLKIESPNWRRPDDADSGEPGCCALEKSYWLRIFVTKDAQLEISEIDPSGSTLETRFVRLGDEGEWDSYDSKARTGKIVSITEKRVGIQTPAGKVNYMKTPYLARAIWDPVRWWWGRNCYEIPSRKTFPDHLDFSRYENDELYSDMYTRMKAYKEQRSKKTSSA